MKTAFISLAASATLVALLVVGVHAALSGLDAITIGQAR